MHMHTRRRIFPPTSSTVSPRRLVHRVSIQFLSSLRRRRLLLLTSSSRPMTLFLYCYYHYSHLHCYSMSAKTWLRMTMMPILVACEDSISSLLLLFSFVVSMLQLTSSTIFSSMMTTTKRRIHDVRIDGLSGLRWILILPKYMRTTMHYHGEDCPEVHRYSSSSSSHWTSTSTWLALHCQKRTESPSFFCVSCLQMAPFTILIRKLLSIEKKSATRKER
mmetsp:Transcript_50623/g.122164  ORF Transcript_50623/g.122164 Transcript_50623/m.122164 type:complete len:219 (+) Transcript_50623:1120-1776(+)